MFHRARRLQVPSPLVGEGQGEGELMQCHRAALPPNTRVL
jgi:hypothetical protein